MSALNALTLLVGLFWLEVELAMFVGQLLRGRDQ